MHATNFAAVFIVFVFTFVVVLVVDLHNFPLIFHL